MPSLRPSWVVQTILPPALLSYFAWGWRTTFWVGRDYLYRARGLHLIGSLYIVGANIFILLITAVYLRLYFLPRKHSVPPPLPPRDLTAGRVIFECSPPARALQHGHALLAADAGDEELEALVAHCEKPACAGRWKPARARHCSECGVCRAGFDHHCAFFANCLTAPYLPTFLALMFYTPIAVPLILAPMYGPACSRAVEAWHASYSDPRALRWWSWTPGWLFPGGPLGRYAVGVGLSWLSLDGEDGGEPAGIRSFGIGALALIGTILAAITFALGWSTLSAILRGELTVDRERHRAYLRARLDASDRVAKGVPPTPAILSALERFAPQYWFFVPLPLGSGISPYAGIVLSTLPYERPYDLGPAGNFAALVSRGTGFRWLLPWNALRTGLPQDELLNWSLAPNVAARLKAEAKAISESAEANGGDTTTSTWKSSARGAGVRDYGSTARASRRG